ncbi:hypothetical protein N7462_010325 [Penicillium macrosclerotiorum]|uniref:uncharacterized protein n=1 Tax=Penicillium macrosclerotiorum TaxID=303699 RepID=UPI0025471FFF|nr:uncharacterized protein N7462_010325 [Penicillium macrosclerotiorum]KAJ5669255.1 hypothetical protein N7462_010325 [Penicillium macrosclerotiorum]
MYRPATRNEWLFCGILLIQAAIIIALEIFILVEWQLWVRPNIIQVTVSYSVPINLAIFIFTCVYELVLAVDAVHHKNNLLIFAICIANVCILVFSGLQIQAMKEVVSDLPCERDDEYHPLVKLDVDFWHRIRPAQWTCPIVFGLCTLVIWPCAYQLHKEYAWAIYRSIRGDIGMKYRYLAYEVYLVLIKLDLYFITGFVIQYDLIDVHFQEPEFGLTLGLLLASFLMMILAIYFVRRENKIAMVMIILCHTAIIAYLLSRIVILYGHGFLAKTAGKNMMLLFAFIALILMVFTLLCAVLCLSNFNCGLKSVLDAKRSEQDAYQFETLSDRAKVSYFPDQRLSIE